MADRHSKCGPSTAGRSCDTRYDATVIVFPWDLSFASETGELAIEPDQDMESGLFRFSVTNQSNAPIRPGRVSLRAPLALQGAGAAVWLHGRYMQQESLRHSFGSDPENESGYGGQYRDASGKTTVFTSHEVLVLESAAQPRPALLFGCVQPGRFSFDIQVTTDPGETQIQSLTLVFDLEESLQLQPGDSVTLPYLLIEDGANPIELFERYADVTGELNSARVPASPPSGWCSWYYYGNQVSESDIRENLAALADGGPAIEVMQIDDGFQSYTGDWLTANSRFPGGMATLAEEIRDTGFRPGLWLAPFVFHEDSTTLREHPGMMVHDREGNLVWAETWLGRCTVLDCTNPLAESWLRDTVRTVVREWGYSYLKLDALAYAAIPAATANYAVSGTTSLMNIRRGLEIIRGAAGDDTFILGCTCHFGPAIGLVDGMRVGPDVAPTWEVGPNPSVRHALRMSLQRNWMHGRWWANDADCLLVRTDNTTLNEAETRFLASAVAASGGLVVLSDNLAEVPASRRAIASALVPSPGVAAKPLDPAESPVASSWRSDLGDKRGLVALLNWSDTARWVATAEFMAPGETAFDVWNAKLAGMGDVLLRPHEGLLFQVAGRSRGARVVGDSGHATMATLYQREVSGRVQVRNDSAAPRTIAVSARQRVLTYDLQPGESRWFD